MPEYHALNLHVDFPRYSKTCLILRLLVRKIYQTAENASNRKAHINNDLADYMALVDYTVANLTL